MKTSTLPSLRVDQSLWEAAASVLQDGETLSAFIEASVRETIERRRARAEFVARVLADLDLAAEAVGVIQHAVRRLRRNPFSCRKAGDDPFLRESLIPFGHNDCVALFEVEDATTVTTLAVRHQREDDYH